MSAQYYLSENKAAFFDFTAVEGWGENKIYTKGWAQGEGGRQMLSIIFVEIIAAIFDFYSSGRLGRKQNLYQGGERQSKEGEGGWALPCPPSPTINSNSKSNMDVWIKNHEPH